MLHFLTNIGYFVNLTSYHFLRETAFWFPAEGAANALEKSMKKIHLKLKISFWVISHLNAKTLHLLCI